MSGEPLWQKASWKNLSLDFTCEKSVPVLLSDKTVRREVCLSIYHITTLLNPSWVRPPSPSHPKLQHGTELGRQGLDQGMQRGQGPGVQVAVMAAVGSDSNGSTDAVQTSSGFRSTILQSPDPAEWTLLLHPLHTTCTRYGMTATGEKTRPWAVSESNGRHLFQHSPPLRQRS